VLTLINNNNPQFTETDATYTKLLLHGNNLLDYSGNAHTLTANGGGYI